MDSKKISPVNSQILLKLCDILKLENSMLLSKHVSTPNHLRMLRAPWNKDQRSIKQSIIFLLSKLDIEMSEANDCANEFCKAHQADIVSSSK